MSLTAYNKRFVRFLTVEKASAWEVYAVLFESDGLSVVAISEPKLVRVVAKDVKALKGSCANPSCLAASKPEEQTQEAIPSPYFPTLFGFSNSEFVIHHSARPPTVR